MYACEDAEVQKLGSGQGVEKWAPCRLDQPTQSRGTAPETRSSLQLDADDLVKRRTSASVDLWLCGPSPASLRLRSTAHRAFQCHGKHPNLNVYRYQYAIFSKHYLALKDATIVLAASSTSLSRTFPQARMKTHT